MGFWIGMAVMALVGLLFLYVEEHHSSTGLTSVGASLKARIARARAATEARETAAKKERAAQEAAARQQREREAFKAKQELLRSVGEGNVVLIESARSSVEKIQASEAAREGWLGDVDFAADIRAITDSFRKARALTKTADELSALENPSVDDRRIMDEATAAASALERAAAERVTLIGRCASEAQLIDESLAKEREEARTAEQRAQLHAKLSELLYGAEAALGPVKEEWAADTVMARVQAYREIKNRISLTRAD